MVTFQMDSLTCFLILFWMRYGLALTEGDLRCYCNDSGCVSTGYMCKSAVGQCFTSIHVRADRVHQTHGCLDSLVKKRWSSCLPVVKLPATRTGHLISKRSETPDSSVVTAEAGGQTLLYCCSEHLCNYRDELDVVVPSQRNNGSFYRGKQTSKSSLSPKASSGQDDKEMWFKAAVIAVPIAGGFILVMLVLLAVKILRTDSHQHRRLIQIRRERLTKSHLYITDHFLADSSKQTSLFANFRNSRNKRKNNPISKGACCSSLTTDTQKCRCKYFQSTDSQNATLSADSSVVHKTSSQPVSKYTTSVNPWPPNSSGYPPSAQSNVRDSDPQRNLCSNLNPHTNYQTSHAFYDSPNSQFILDSLTNVSNNSPVANV